MGLGGCGGGVAVCRFLAERGARLTVTDHKPADELADALAAIAHIPIERFRLGEHRPEDFENADVVVANPAVRPDNAFLQLAAQSGAHVTTEIGLFWDENPGQVIGVTGSNGKSTTAALIHHSLASAGRRVWLGGNIGGSLLDRIGEIRSGDWVVLELSSFQLFHLDRKQVSPQVAVVTNFSPNHLDWHDSVENYRRAKQTIIRWQSDSATAVLSADSPDPANWSGRARRILCGCRSITSGDSVQLVEAATEKEARLKIRLESLQAELPIGRWLHLPGRHNRQNAAAAVAAALSAGLDPCELDAGLSIFRGLHHRREPVAVVNGRAFYNDSIATTPESAIAALQSFTQPIVLLAGGYDKHQDLTDFAHQIRSRCKAVALLGQTAASLHQHLTCSDSIDPSGEPSQQQTAPIRITIPEDFESAFRWSIEQSAWGDVILLSPGCASYGWFRNFTDRGNQFRTLVSRLEDAT